MNAFSNKEKVSSQKCFSTSFNQKLILSPLPNKEELKDIFRPNVIYASQLENQIVDFFWQNWSNNDRLLINPNKLNLFVDKNNKESYIQSQVFKTYLQSTQYHFEIQPEIFSGSMEVTFIFSKKGIPYHQIGYVITKEAEAYVVQNYELDDGVHLNMEKLTYKDSIPKFIIEGPIANRRIPLDAKDKNKYKICKCALEDISIKILIKNLKDGEGYIEILKGLVVRADAKTDPK
jgi:Fe-S cluster biosynthesis and repair protein YggX